MKDRLFLAAGVAGLALAMVGALGAPRPDALGLGAAAVVNGTPIPKQAALRAVEALEGDKRNAVTTDDAKAALERLIEEELLVQRGIALGLAETDLAARKAIVQSVLQLAVAERAGQEPDETTLRKFYEENAGFFTPSGRIAGTLVYIVRDARTQARAAAAEAALARGAPVAGLGDPQALELPAGPLGPGELRTYLGASFAAQAMAAKPGMVLRSEDPEGVRLLRIDRVVAPTSARFEDVEAEVRAEWTRRADEAAVRAYIERLKRQARIVRAP